MKTYAYLLIVFVVCIFQSQWGGKTRLDILLLMVLYFSFFHGMTSAALFGLYTGALLDIFSSSDSGTFLLTYMLLGISAGWFHGKVFPENFAFAVTLAFLGTVIRDFLLTAFGGKILFSWLELLRACTLSLMMSFPVYWLLKKLDYDRKVFAV